MLCIRLYNFKLRILVNYHFFKYSFTALFLQPLFIFQFYLSNLTETASRLTTRYFHYENIHVVNIKLELGENSRCLYKTTNSSFTPNTGYEKAYLTFRLIWRGHNYPPMGIHEEYKGVRRNMVSEACQTYLIKLRNPSLLATSDTVLAKFLLKARAALSFYKWSEVM